MTANRRLAPEELALARTLLDDIRARLETLAGDDTALLHAYRRKVMKELGYDERGNPSLRKKLKALLRERQQGLCAECGQPLPETYTVLHRLRAEAGSTEDNTRLICQDCHRRVQAERGYR